MYFTRGYSYHPTCKMYFKYIVGWGTLRPRHNSGYYYLVAQPPCLRERKSLRKLRCVHTLLQRCLFSWYSSCNLVACRCCTRYPHAYAHPQYIIGSNQDRDDREEINREFQVLFLWIGIKPQFHVKALKSDFWIVN